MAEDLIKINVFIAGRSYPLKIKPSEEKQVQEIVERVESRIKDLKSRYPQKDAQDYLAMTILTLGSDFSTEHQSLESAVDQKMDTIKGWIDQITD